MREYRKKHIRHVGDAMKTFPNKLQLLVGRRLIFVGHVQLGGVVVNVLKMHDDFD
jgi:hypothetical protein